MPYQNNNNRVNPNPIGKYKINPVANPVDKQLRFQPDLSSSNKTQGIGNALAQIGQGVYDFGESDFLKKKAEEEAIMLHTADIEAGNNQHEWKEASKRIKGLAKFNPYIKDRYMELAASEMFKQAQANLISLPEAYKHSNDDVLKHIQAQKDELKSKLLGLGLPTSVAAPQLKAYEALCDEYYTQYIDKNAEYTNGLAYGMEASALTSQLRNNAYEGTKGQYERFKSSLDAVVQGSVERGGIPADILAKTVYPAIKSTINQIASDPNSTLQLADIVQAAKEIEIDGMKLSDVDPDLEYNLRQQYLSAYRQRTAEEELEYNNMVRRDQMNNYKAEKEFYDTFYQNPDMPLSQVQELAISTAQKYGISEKARSFLTDAHSVQQLAYNWHNTKSNPETIKALNLALVRGELTPQIVEDALMSGQLSNHDFMSYNDRLNREAVAEQKASLAQATSDYKKITDLFTTSFKDKNFTKQLTSSMGKDGFNELIEKVNQIKAQYQQGELPVGEAANQLNKLYNRIEKVNTNYQSFKENDVANFKPIDLMKAAYYTKLPINVKCNQAQAEQAIRGMGIFRTNENIRVSSMMSANRKHPVTGKNQPHTGTDVAVAVGTPLYLPRGFTGTVITSGEHAKAGKYILIQLDGTGDFIKVLHLSKALPAGSKIGMNTIFAYSGNTGIGTGAHAHFEFYESDGSTIYDPRSFAVQMNLPQKKK